MQSKSPSAASSPEPLVSPGQGVSSTGAEAVREEHGVAACDGGLRSPGFWSLMATQFQGAFSDNAFKLVVTFIVMGIGFSPEQRDQLAPAVGAVFALPFILFSMMGGCLADRYSKRTVAIATKYAEVLIMLVALAGFWFQSIPLLIATVFLLSAQSAFFGPAKYGLLPEMLPRQELSRGNGILNLGTFVAIIMGMVAAGFLSDWFAGRRAWIGVLLLLLAGSGLLASHGIGRVPAANPGRVIRLNMAGELWRQMGRIRQDRVLFLAVLGGAYFWFIAALLQLTILFYGKNVLELGDKQTGYLMASLAVGIGSGSLVAGYVSGKRIEYGLVPLGALGMVTLMGMLAWPGIGYLPFLMLLGMLGFAGGFYIVPVNALIQHRPEARHKGSVIATGAVLAFTGVFLASVLYMGLKRGLGWSEAQVFLAGSCLTLGVTLYVLWLLPHALLRLLAWCVTHSFYRIRVSGHENLPEEGGALLVANHVTLVDGLLLQATTGRPIRFLVHRSFYERRWLYPLMRIAGAIPVASDEGPREMVRSLQSAREAIAQGELVCIFAEGEMTRLGVLLPFRRGLERIAKGLKAPVVPVCLEGLWGSIFSFEGARFIWKMPHTIPYPMSIAFGAPAPAGSSAMELRQAVQELSSEAWEMRKERMQPLHRAFIKKARRQPFRFSMGDQRAPKVNFGAAMMRMVFLARRLKPLWSGQEMVGILLPPSVAGALVNFAALLMGKVPVNLNYAASEEVLASCIRQCGIRTVVTSEVFLKRVKLNIPCEALKLEEVAAQPRPVEKLAALFASWLLPLAWLERFVGREKPASMDDLATVIFSSGSTGDPKGVMLSHYNVASNIEQVRQVYDFQADDRFLGVLPFFHSFGFMGTLMLTGTLGIGVVYHPNPREGKAIGELAGRYGISFLIATPTLLQMYLRACQPDDFRTVKIVLTGAEKLPERLAAAFHEKFGARPLEGYGCAECSPVVAANRPDVMEGDRVRQKGNKSGSIGRAMPGISVKVVDPETMQPVGVSQPGLLLVKGPNVMQGYLNKPEQTAEALRDGWYATGDIVAQDEEGFLFITDRLSRFSKIGGEMAPHIKIEEKLHELAGVTEQVFAVTGIPDERKGERLVVLHTLPEEEIAALLCRLQEIDLPNLWMPKPNHFFRLEALPMLGTGKLDFRGIQAKAVELLRNEPMDHSPSGHQPHG